jgi:diguanylate cyclase (GGDEF)-like protein/PAS domain S-box-containing protein
MKLWLAQLALPVNAWLPLGLATAIPFVLFAVIVPLSRRRSRGIATALTMRTVLMLAVGFAALTAVATFAVVHTGLSELRQRHASDVRALAEALEQSPLGLAGGDAQLRLTLFLAKDAHADFAAAGANACQSLCAVSFRDPRLDARAVKAQILKVWPEAADDRRTITVGRKLYLIVGAPLKDIGGKQRSMAIVGIDASHLADQAARTGWLLIGMSYMLLVIVGLSEWKQVRRSLASRIHSITTQLRSGVADESHAYLDVDGIELRDLADTVSSYIKRSIDEKSSSDERYRQLVELAPDAVLMCSDGRIRLVNPAAVALAGARSRTDLLASPIEKFIAFDLEESADNRGALRPATWTRLDGSTLHVEVAEIADSSSDSARQYLVRDVTHRRQREAALEHRAHHDSLTGLVNRAHFETRLAELLEPHETPGKPSDAREIAVLFIDLDGFKPVNDIHGHAAGDAVLKAVAGRLRESTRGTDLVARFGGDEFAVLIEVRDPAEVAVVANRIRRALQQPMVFEGATLRVGASIGIASGPTAAESADAAADARVSAADLLKSADAAMYEAKSSGGGRHVIAERSEQSLGERPDISFPALV